MSPTDYTSLTVRGGAALWRLAGRVYAIYGGAASAALLMNPECRRAGSVPVAALSALLVWLVGRTFARRGADLSCPPGHGDGRRLLTVVWPAGLACLALTVLLTADASASSQRLIVGWAVDAVAVSAALAAGAWWGLTSLLLLDAGYLGLCALAGFPTEPSLVFDTPVSVAVGAVVHVGASRGFTRTESAKQAVRDAEVARLAADHELSVRRALDRELHDTLLSTLSLLAQGGSAAHREQVLATCRRDLGFLITDSWGGEDHRPPVAGPSAGARPELRAGPGSLLDHLLRQLVAEAAGRGLTVRTHVTRQRVDQPPPGGSAPDERVLAVWRGAVAECLANTARHAQVEAADVVIDLSRTELLTVVLDEGRGFSPTAVGPGRLGLTASVHERVGDVGGSVRVWSRAGRGTAVELRLPLGAA